MDVGGGKCVALMEEGQRRVRWVEAEGLCNGLYRHRGRRLARAAGIKRDPWTLCENTDSHQQLADDGGKQAEPRLDCSAPPPFTPTSQLTHSLEWS